MLITMSMDLYQQMSNEKALKRDTNTARWL